VNYQSGGAFRRALEQRLTTITLNSGTPLVRLRKLVAFDRFLARMVNAQPDSWVLKGGLALQLRLRGIARTTKDIDLLAFAQPENVLVRLREAASLYLGDWFTFEVAEPVRMSIPEQTGLRYTVQSLLDGRVFEQFHIDIGIGDAIIEPVELLETTDLLAFAGLSPTHVPCYPVTQQIAEKLHAYTRPRRTGESSRVKDFVDILLLSGLELISSERIFRAIQATFSTEETHPIPIKVPPPPKKWDRELRRLAVDVGMDSLSLEGAYRIIQQFLDPVLTGESLKEWNPVRKEWVE
jgi:hypothetical protein